MYTHSIVLPSIGISTCTYEYIQQQYLILEVLVKSGIGVALVVNIATKNNETYPFRH